MRSFSIVVAFDESGGIGIKGKLPWHLPADLKYFKKITTHVRGPEHINAVIMGRITWESIPSEFRPLPGRINVILSRNRSLQKPEDVLLADSLNASLEDLDQGSYQSQVENVYVIGGQQIFKDAVVHPLCQKIYVTRILKSFN